MALNTVREAFFAWISYEKYYDKIYVILYLGNEIAPDGWQKN
jgi:hypothetical protein